MLLLLVITKLRYLCLIKNFYTWELVKLWAIILTVYDNIV